MTPILSILIPSVPSRLYQGAQILPPGLRLFVNLCAAAEAYPRGMVEVLMLTDNKTRRVGLKRQALLDAARGAYVAFVDDDDDVSPDYISAILRETAHGPDVITFLQEAQINGQRGTIHFAADHAHDEPCKAGAIAKRRPWHVCAWRAEIAKQCLFTDKMFGEDLDWVNQACSLLRTGRHIDRVLHTYRYSTETSEAPAGV